MCEKRFRKWSLKEYTFLLLVFFMNQFTPSPKVSHEDHFNFFRKFAEIFASQGAPPVSTTPSANFATSFASVVDTGGTNGKKIRLLRP
jgi:hypothetical protein